MTKIVQCPSCNTKFALNESQLAGVETPKFQCSRCQTIFNLTETDETETLLKEIKKPELPLEKSKEDNKSGVWDLGDATNREPDEVDPFLKDFSIDIGKFSVGKESFTSNTLSSKEESVSTQLDFGFNQPTISHGPQNSPIRNPLENNISETSHRDSPNMVGGRLDMNTLDNIIYGESGQKDNPISVDWDTDDTEQVEASDHRKVKDDFDKTSVDLGPPVDFNKTSIDLGPPVDFDKASIDLKAQLDFEKIKADPEAVEEIKNAEIGQQEPSDIGDLSNIFRRGSQRSSTGTHFIVDDSNRSTSGGHFYNETVIDDSNKSTSGAHYYNKTEENDSASDLVRPTEVDSKPIESTAPSWSELKEKIEKQEEDTDSPSALVPKVLDPPEPNLPEPSSLDLLNFPFQDPAENSSDRNRSMKHTTVMQRDALDVEGFLQPVDEDEEYSEASSPNIPFSIKSKLREFAGILKYVLSKPRNLAPFTRSLLLAWSVPLLFIILLFLWGQTLSNKQNLNSAESAFADAVALFTPPELLLPPVNLVVNNLIAELRPDKSGEPMIVISGNIFNAGLQAAVNATVEARSFDNENMQVKSILAPVPNELSKFNSSLDLTGLTQGEILELQNKRSGNSIAPGNPIPFKLVVTDIGKGYKYFSAKIYSVGQIG